MSDLCPPISSLLVKTPSRTLPIRSFDFVGDDALSVDLSNNHSGLMLVSVFIPTQPVANLDGFWPAVLVDITIMLIIECLEQAHSPINEMFVSGSV